MQAILPLTTNSCCCMFTQPVLRLCVYAVVSRRHYSSQFSKKGLARLISQQDASTLFKSWANQMWFAPKAWKENLGTKIDCHYLPFWYFSGNGEISYVGRVATDRAFPVMVNGFVIFFHAKDWKPTGTRHFKYQFHHGVYGSNEFERGHVIDLSPWENEKIGDLSASALADAVVDPCTIDEEKAYKMAWDEYICEDAKDFCKRDMMCDFLNDHYEVTKMDLKEVSLSHILIYLPVYISTFNYKGSEYKILMNARSGKVQGYRQYDATGISLSIFGISSIVCASFNYLTGTSVDPIIIPSLLFITPLLVGLVVRFYPQSAPLKHISFSSMTPSFMERSQQEKIQPYTQEQYKHQQSKQDQQSKQ